MINRIEYCIKQKNPLYQRNYSILLIPCIFLYLNENILIRINGGEIFPFALIFAHADQILQSFQGIPGVVADVDRQGGDLVFEGSGSQDARHPLFVRF